MGGILGMMVKSKKRVAKHFGGAFFALWSEGIIA